MLDTSLLITVLIIFAATLLGAILRALRRDRCLDDLDHYHVTVDLADGRVIWGSMRLHATGFELSYRDDVVSDRYGVKTSFLMYKDEFPKMHAIYRYAVDLSPEQRRRRDRAYRQVFHPGPATYTTRQIRNFVNTAADSLSEALNLVLGKSRVMRSELVLASGQSHLQGLTKEVLGYVGTSYDPLIESFVGAQVVVEVTLEKQVYEYVGVLKDYSASFLQIMDVEFAQIVQLEMQRSNDDGREDCLQRVWCGLEADCQDDLVIIRNHTENDTMLEGVRLDGDTRAEQTLIGQGHEYRYALPHGVREELVLTLKTVRRLDMVLPRAHALIRHRAERYQASDAFDLRLQLEALLERTHGQADVSALLLRRAQIDEADRQLARAFSIRHRLPGLQQDGAPCAQAASQHKEAPRAGGPDG